MYKIFMDKKERHRQSQAKYRKSEKGRETIMNYRRAHAEKERERSKAYQASPHGKEVRQKWLEKNPGYGTNKSKNWQKKQRMIDKKLREY